MVQKRVTYLLFSTLLIILMIPNGGSLSAESINDVNKKINKLDKEHDDLKTKQGEVNNSKKNTEGKMNENKDKQSSVEQEIHTIDKKLGETKADIQSKEAEITTTNNEIDSLIKDITKLEEEIQVLEERIKQREELLRDRLRSIQHNGGQLKYMDVILGSQSFADFISRSSAVNTIMDQDKSIMEEHAADKKALEQKKVETEEKKEKVEEKKASLEEQKNKLVALKTQLDDQVAEKERLMAELEEQYVELEELQLSLEEEQQILAGEAAALEKAKQLAQGEKAKLEQLAKEEEARKAAAASGSKAGQSSSSNSSSSPSSSSSSSSSSAVGSSGGGSFGWPAQGGMGPRSGFGPRIHPITGEVGKMHKGIDIQAGHGASVSASAAGVVNTAGWMGGYGNTITISHYIGGKSYTTLYAHLSSISVSAGQTVSRGQVIGAVGSTGNSTGPHLHFEVHVGGFGNPQNPLNYLR